MKSLAIAACCGFALSVTAGLAQAQTSHTSVPRADTNSTGNVTLAEYQTSREAFIMKADTNHDGKVSRAEWDTFATAVRRDLDLGGVKGAERIGQGAWWTKFLIQTKDSGISIWAAVEAELKSQMQQH